MGESCVGDEAADAQKAVDLGFDGIVVSNHAGRQVDGAVASLDALEKIVDGMLS
jgi:isopentenyl diphosphate isomerase/L-lactate dehydrogenase-like FMN-dependent dehydrogenase